MAKAKINEAAVNEWKAEIGKIESKIQDILSDFLAKVNSTSDCFEGNAADGLCDSIKDFITSSSGYTKRLNNLANQLDTVVKVMKNQ